jgi:hypothetical protein
MNVRQLYLKINQLCITHYFLLQYLRMYYELTTIRDLHYFRLSFHLEQSFHLNSKGKRSSILFVRRSTPVDTAHKQPTRNANQVPILSLSRQIFHSLITPCRELCRTSYSLASFCFLEIIAWTKSTGAQMPFSHSRVKYFQVCMKHTLMQWAINRGR